MAKENFVQPEVEVINAADPILTEKVEDPQLPASQSEKDIKELEEKNYILKESQRYYDMQYKL